MAFYTPSYFIPKYPLGPWYNGAAPIFGPAEQNNYIHSLSPEQPVYPN